MKTIAGFVACLAALWTVVVSADPVTQPLPQVKKSVLVPSLDSPDKVDIRIWCFSGDGTGCTVLLHCLDQAEVPRNIAGEIGVVPDEAAEILTRRDIATMTGVTEWTGHLWCEVQSTHAIDVQVLVRATRSRIML